MTEKQAEEVASILKSIKTLRALQDRIHFLYKKNELSELGAIALEMQSELLRIHEERLSRFDTGK